MGRGGWVLLGALVASVAAVFVLAPRWPRPRAVLVLAVSAVLVVAPVAVLVLLLAVLASVHGVATGAVVVPLVGLAVLGSWARGWLGLRSGSPEERLRRPRAR